MLDRVGVPCELKVLRGAGHGGKGFPADRMNKMVLEFFNRYFKQER